MNREEIEIQLWEYIDGACNEQYRQRISGLIATDNVWKQLFSELTLLQATIPASTELEQPSLRFTKNVMDAVAATHIAPATKKYISKSTVTVIAALFIVLLVFAIGYTVATANWNDTGNNGNPKLNLNLNTFFNSTTLTAFTFINIVLALAVVDKLLRRKYNVHN